jgi:uncharacterized protein YfaS (alpha-2-macroglobulin family)
MKACHRLRCGGFAVVCLAAALAGCSKSAPLLGEGDHSRVASYGVDEASLIATPGPSGLDVSFNVEREGGSPAAVEAAIEILDLDGTRVGSGTASPLIGNGTTAVRVSVPGVQIPDEEQGKYVIHYRLLTPAGELGGRRSLLMATRRLAATILSTDVFFQGAAPHVRVLARDPSTQAVLTGAAVDVLFDRGDAGVTPMGQGMTDDTGTVSVPIVVPTDFEGSGKLRVSVRLGDRVTTADFAAVVRREARVLLTTDKPIYQPGQTIHLRILALRRGDRRPESDRPVLFEILDGRGNKVYKNTQRTSTFGIASADFDLATLVNMGRYTVRATLGETTVEKAVTVDEYALPKFKVDVASRSSFYLPGQTVAGEVRAQYFFGRSVSGASVVIRGETLDVQPTAFAEIRGVTGDDGSFPYELPLPTVLVGLPLDQGKAQVVLKVSVTDGAGHEEKVERPLLVAQSGLVAKLIPETQSLIPGIEQVLYLLASDPSGVPRRASGSVTVRDSTGGVQNQPVQTDDTGFAELHFTASSESTYLSVTGLLADDRGYSTNLYFTWSGGSQSSVGSLLLRPDRSLYGVGDTAHFDVLVRGSDRVYADVVKGGQTVLARTLVAQDNHAAFDLELDETLSGTLQVHVYYLAPDSQIVRDSRSIYVKSAGELQVDLTPDQDQYRPRDTARLAIQVRDGSGQGVPAALGVQVVDEAVFALSENQPGLEKTFFSIEGDIQTPAVEVDGWTFNDVLSGAPDDLSQRKAQVLFAAAGAGAGYAISYDSWLTAKQKAAQYANAKVSQDAQTIVQAVVQAAQTWNTMSPTVAAEAFVRGNQGRWFDPWGQPYAVEVNGYYLTVRSAGLDERTGTDDDVNVQSYLSLYDNGRTEFGGDGDHANGAPPGPGGVPNAGATVPGVDPAAGKTDTAAAPVVRQYFPETLLVSPQVITDENGRATLEIPLADSITSWRVSSLASSVAGLLGSSSAGLKVFQDFFVDIDFPATLTRGDEVSVPIAIYNYLGDAQDVRLVAEASPGFELVDGSEQTVTVAANSVSGASFRVRTAQVGRYDFTVTAYGTNVSDAVRRRVDIKPDGKRFTATASDLLSGEVSRTFAFPAGAVPGSQQLLLKVYPGVFSQAVEGLDSVLQMPSGCFEQTSSSTYPDLLALEYMNETGQSTPEIDLKARSYVNAGYQRLLTFEVPGGGFEWFGHAPANQVLTAYGLMEFTDMAKVHPVDETMLARTRAWLVSQQTADGSFTPDESYLHQDVWGTMQHARPLATSYIIWGLAASGPHDAPVQKGVAYLKAHRGDIQDAYGKALLANALVAYDLQDPVTSEVLGELADMAEVENGAASWPGRGGSITYSKDDVLRLEATALAVYALLQANYDPGLIQSALAYLVRNKDEFGNWHATQATVLSLKALLATLRGSRTPVNAQVGIQVNGTAMAPVTITPADQDVLHQVDLTPFLQDGDNTVQLVTAGGGGSLLYQLSAAYHLPWSVVGPPPQEPISITVAYDRTTLAVNEEVGVTATVTNNVAGTTVNMALVDLGLPPGFDLVPDKLVAAVQQGTIEKFERTDRQLLVYVRKLVAGTPMAIQYSLRAKTVLRAEAPASRAYAYYNPEQVGTARPVALEVTP